MEATLLYPEEHTGCCNYAKIDRRLQDNGQAIYDNCLEKNETKERFLQDTKIMLVMSGALRLSGNGLTSIRLENGDMILLPVGHKYIVAAEEKSRYLVCKVPTGIELCEKYSMNQLYDEKHKIKKRGEFTTLKMNQRVWGFVDNVVDCISDGLKCVKYMRIKITELMFMLRAYYAKEALADFFYPILNKDMEFANIVFSNWQNVKNKTELAALANLSPSRFGVKFKDVFGVSPYQWLINQRSERIYYELVYTNHSLKEISEMFKFGSVQHFNDFCKKQFGKTPGRIRESR